MVIIVMGLVSLVFLILGLALTQAFRFRIRIQQALEATDQTLTQDDWDENEG
jgi:CHASE3 domain sensor protein|tara:strand:- start:795 stop:950 length:156 start_codon:yes stop_codon:yes gene_type:complete